LPLLTFRNWRTMAQPSYTVHARTQPRFRGGYRVLSAAFALFAVWLLTGCTGIIVPSSKTGPTLSVTVSSLPQAKVKTTYAANLTATGGKTPYTWSLNSGSLPSGLSLDSISGIISGTPTQSGTSSFGVQVKDSSSTPQIANQNLSLAVASTVSPVSITSTTLSAGQQGTPYSAALSATGGTTPYTWSIVAGQLPAGLSLNSASGQITGTPTQVGMSDFTVQLQDSSSPSQTATQALSITINASTTTVSVSTKSLPSGQQNVVYSSSLSASGGTAPYSWSVASGQLPAGITLSSGGVFSGTPTASGTSYFTIKVVDSSSPTQTTSVNLSIVIAAAVQPLQITTSTLPAAATSTTYSADLSASGGTPPYTWSTLSGSLPAGLSLSSSGQITGTPTQSGSSTFTIQVADAEAPAQTATKSFTITVSLKGGPLQITVVGFAGGQVGITYSAPVSAIGGVTPYTWSVSSGALPPGLQLSSAASTVTGTPTQSGSFAFTLQAKDSSATPQTASQSFTIVIAAAVPAVQISSTSLAAGQVNSSYAATLTATGGKTPYDWSITTGSLPAGLTLNASTGQISGSPTQSGTASFTVQVKDSSSTPETATQVLSITVAAAVTPVSITTSSLANGQQGTAYSATLAATGGTTPYTWSLSSGALPLGLSLSSSGVVSGTPTASGTSTFTAKVTDSTTPTAQTATRTYTITVAAAVTPLQITTSSLAAGQVGTAYSVTVQASGGTTPYSWSLTSGALPAGLSLTAASGAISGTPTTSGTYAFTVKATDSTTPTAQTATKSLTLTVAVAATPVQVTTASLPGGEVGIAYSATLTATNGTAPYSWSLTSGSLPAGLTLATSGVISGTPTTAATSSFTVKVTDSSSPTTTATANLSITITVASNYSVLLNWTASPSSGVAGYNVYRSQVSGSDYVKLTSSPVSDLTYTDTSVANGQTYYYVTTSVDGSGNESGYSEIVQMNIP
jgi:hypothetical protein